MVSNEPRRHYGYNSSRARARTRSHDDGLLSSFRPVRACAPYSLQGFPSRTTPGSQHQHGLSHGISFPRGCRRLYPAPQFGPGGWYGMPPSASLNGTIPGPTNGVHHPLSIATSLTPNVSTSETPSVAEDHHKEWVWNTAGELGTSTPCFFQTHDILMSPHGSLVPDRSY
jgi:hypothetical protein